MTNNADISISNLWRTGRVLLCPMLLGAVAATPALAQAPEPVSGIYTCTDAQGRKLRSDRPIAECIDREQRVLNPSGTVRARVGPTLTAAERAAAEKARREADEARAREAEDRRRERALLVRYPSQETHDKERAEALAQVAAVEDAANRRIDALNEDQRKIDQEMEFYKKDPAKAPTMLRRQIEFVAQSLESQHRFIREQQMEKQRINTRFDEERLQLLPLWKALGR